MISIRKQRCLLHLHDMFRWRKVLCTGFLFRGREMEHGASWFACRKVISMSAGKGKHIKLTPRVPKPMQSHWEGRRGSGCWGPCRSRLLGASRGCSLRCWVLAAGAAPWVPLALCGSHPAGRPPGGQEPVVLVKGNEGFVPAAGVEFPGIAGPYLWWCEECWGC